MEIDVGTSYEEEEDLYTRLKVLQRQLEFFDIQVCRFSCSTGRQGAMRYRKPSLCLADTAMEALQQNAGVF
jgi:hypothetical protein